MHHFSYSILFFVANAMVGPRTWIGGILGRSGNKRFGSDKFLTFPLTPMQVNSVNLLSTKVVYGSMLNLDFSGPFLLSL